MRQHAPYLTNLNQVNDNIILWDSKEKRLRYTYSLYTIPSPYLGCYLYAVDSSRYVQPKTYGQVFRDIRKFVTFTQLKEKDMPKEFLAQLLIMGIN